MELTTEARGKIVSAVGLCLMLLAGVANDLHWPRSLALYARALLVLGGIAIALGVRTFLRARQGRMR